MHLSFRIAASNYPANMDLFTLSPAPAGIRYFVGIMAENGATVPVIVETDGKVHIHSWYNGGANGTLNMYGFSRI